MSKIFIYGVPGAGKTMYSRNLGLEMNCQIIEADTLRDIAQKEKTEQEEPFLYVGTTEAFRKFGELTEENVISGLQAVREVLAPYVLKELEKYSGDFIMEAAFLKPDELLNQGKLMLIVTTDKEKHHTQYFQHREQNEKSLDNFKAARIIQDYLIKEAGNYSVEIIENNFDFKSI